MVCSRMSKLSSQLVPKPNCGEARPVRITFWISDNSPVRSGRILRSILSGITSNLRQAACCGPSAVNWGTSFVHKQADQRCHRADIADKIDGLQVEAV